MTQPVEYTVKTRASGRKRQHPSTPLGNLFNTYDISLSRVENWLLNAGEKISSTSTISRLVNGKAGPAYSERLRKLIAVAFREHLLELGHSQSEIDTQLTAVFNEGEYQPMISKRRKLSDAECAFFGFHDNEGKPLDPFKKHPESMAEVFFPPALRQIYDDVMDAIKYRHFIAVLGGIGSGKTTLRNIIEDKIVSEGNVKLIWPEFFDQFQISPMEIAKIILRECDVPKPPGRAAALGTAVKNKLKSMTENGQRVALAFDECHKMSPKAIRSLKNFFEMSSGGFQKYLGIVLFGWPSFGSTLLDPEFQEIYERVHVIEMPGFEDYAVDYLAHRFKLVGVKLNDLFDKRAIDLIIQRSHTPLSIGNITNHALQISHALGEKRVAGAAIESDDFFQTQEQGFRKR